MMRTGFEPTSAMSTNRTLSSIGPIKARNRSIFVRLIATNTGSSFSTAPLMNGSVRSRNSDSPQ
jgi:hypothetical protein